MNLPLPNPASISSSFLNWIAVITLVCPLVGLASELKLETVLDSVNQNYPLLLQTRRDFQKSQADLLAAQGGFDPILKASTHNVPIGYYRHDYYDLSVEQPTTLWGSRISGGWRRGDGKFSIYDGKLATFTEGEVRVGIDIPLLRNGMIDERRNKILSAENGIGLTQSSNAVVLLEVTRLATYRYWDWLAAGKKLGIVEGLLELALTRDKNLLHRYQKGDASQFDYQENQRVVIQRRSSLLGAERAFQKATFELSLYYRDQDGNPFLAKRDLLPARFPKPATHAEEKEKTQDKNEGAEPGKEERTAKEERTEKGEGAEKEEKTENTEGNEKESTLPNSEILTLVDSHPEIKRLQFQMNQNEIDLRLSRNTLLPRLDFQLGYAKDLGEPPPVESASSYSLQPLAKYPAEFKVAVTFELPLLFRTARGQIQSIQAVYNRIEDQTILARNKIQTTIYDSLQAMAVSRKRAELAVKELELARVLEEGERVRFRQGDSQLFIVNLREQSTGEAAIKEVDAIADYYRAKADYLAVVTR